MKNYVSEKNAFDFDFLSRVAYWECAVPENIHTPPTEGFLF